MSSNNGSICAHVEETENLALGHLEDKAAASARMHLETCTDCQTAHAMFASERALFAVHREQHAVLAPEVAPFLDLSFTESSVPVDVDGRSRFARVLPAMLAVAAGVFALVNVGDLHHQQTRMESGHGVVIAQTSSGAAPEIPSDETLACTWPGASPAHGHAHHPTSSLASQTLKEDLNMSVSNMSEDRTRTAIACEPQLVSVTSSSSTP